MVQPLPPPAGAASDGGACCGDVVALAAQTTDASVAAYIIAAATIMARNNFMQIASRECPGPRPGFVLPRTLIECIRHGQSTESSKSS
jgi:hypothetical protein